jgi:3',5'-cyclic AMP phosphodiesterase CpdA
MKLVLISDTHLTPRAAAYRDNWYIVAAWIEAIAPDLVVHLGDITADGAHDIPIPTITIVPSRALPKPPPISNPAGGSSVKISQWSRDPPRTMSMYSTEIRGMAAMIAAIQAPVVSSRLFKARGSNADRRRLGSASVAGATATSRSLISPSPPSKPEP